MPRVRDEIHSRLLEWGDYALADLLYTGFSPVNHIYRLWEVRTEHKGMPRSKELIKDRPGWVWRLDRQIYSLPEQQQKAIILRYCWWKTENGEAVSNRDRAREMGMLLGEYKGLLRATRKRLK